MLPGRLQIDGNTPGMIMNSEIKEHIFFGDRQWVLRKFNPVNRSNFCRASSKFVASPTMKICMCRPVRCFLIFESKYHFQRQNKSCIQRRPRTHWSHSQAIQSGNMLFLSGQIAINRSTDSSLPWHDSGKAHQVMKNLYEVLKAGGMDFSMS